eukprot:15349389-Ditylum_brightwellii.AAC.1
MTSTWSHPSSHAYSLSDSGYTATNTTQCPVIADTRASCGITPFATDFVDPLQPTIPFIYGMNVKAEVKGFGIAKWSVKDDTTGNVVTLLAPVYHVPLAEVRLLSQQQCFQHSSSGSLFADKDTCHLTTASGATIVIPYFTNNLPSFSPHTPVNMMVNVLSALNDDSKLLLLDNTNMSAPQQELLTWHCTLGHIGFDWLKELMSPYQYKGDTEKQVSIVKTKHPTLHTCTSPQCCSCLLANGQHCYPSGTHTYCNPKSEGMLKLGNLKPGNTVSTG